MRVPGQRFQATCMGAPELKCWAAGQDAKAFSCVVFPPVCHRLPRDARCTTALPPSSPMRIHTPIPSRATVYQVVHRTFSAKLQSSPGTMAPPVMRVVIFRLLDESCTCSRAGGKRQSSVQYQVTRAAPFARASCTVAVHCTVRSTLGGWRRAHRIAIACFRSALYKSQPVTLLPPRLFITQAAPACRRRLCLS